YAITETPAVSSFLQGSKLVLGTGGDRFIGVSIVWLLPWALTIWKVNHIDHKGNTCTLTKTKGKKIRLQTNAGVFSLVWGKQKIRQDKQCVPFRDYTNLLIRRSSIVFKTLSESMPKHIFTFVRFLHGESSCPSS
ncbi:MAG: hypothetical protein AAF348_19800, partial [Bacteroidota bacterium]